MSESDDENAEFETFNPMMKDDDDYSYHSEEEEEQTPQVQAAASPHTAQQPQTTTMDDDIVLDESASQEVKKEKTFPEDVVRTVLDEHVDKLIEEISNVQNTGFWLAIFGTFYTLIEILHFPFVTVVSLVLLFQAAGVHALIKLQPMMVEAGILDPDLGSVEWLAEQGQAFSDREIRSVTKGLAGLGKIWFKYWEDDVLAGEEVDMLVIHAGAFIALIIWGALVSLSTTLFLAGVGIATFPMMASQYASNKGLVDTIMQDIALPSIEDLTQQMTERFGSD